MTATLTKSEDVAMVPVLLTSSIESSGLARAAPSACSRMNKRISITMPLPVGIRRMRTITQRETSRAGMECIVLGRQVKARVQCAGLRPMTDGMTPPWQLPLSNTVRETVR